MLAGDDGPQEAMPHFMSRKPLINRVEHEIDQCEARGPENAAEAHVLAGAVLARIGPVVLLTGAASRLSGAYVGDGCGKCHLMRV